MDEGETYLSMDSRNMAEKIDVVELVSSSVNET